MLSSGNCCQRGVCLMLLKGPLRGVVCSAAVESTMCALCGHWYKSEINNFQHVLDSVNDNTLYFYQSRKYRGIQNIHASSLFCTHGSGLRNRFAIMMISTRYSYGVTYPVDVDCWSNYVCRDLHRCWTSLGVTVVRNWCLCQRQKLLLKDKICCL